MKKIGSICIEYIGEVACIILFILYTLSSQQLSLSNLFITILFYILCQGLPYIIRIFHKPIQCKILYIKKNIIHMEPIYYKNKTQFIDDFEIILNFAKSKKIDSLKTNTHTLILLHVLCKYASFSKKDAVKLCKNMGVRDVNTVRSSFGRIEFVRLPDGVNICARYEYKRNLNRKIFFKSIKNIKRFRVNLLLT